MYFLLLWRERKPRRAQKQLNGQSTYAYWLLASCYRRRHRLKSFVRSGGRMSQSVQKIPNFYDCLPIIDDGFFIHSFQSYNSSSHSSQKTAKLQTKDIEHDIIYIMFNSIVTKKKEYTGHRYSIINYVSNASC
jgi:hypothetical protein